VTVHYSYEAEYFDVEIKEQVKKVDAHKQAREVVEVHLTGQKDDVNSLVDVTVNMEATSYNLWLPAIFVRFGTATESTPESIDRTTKTVYLSKPFAMENDPQKLLPQLYFGGKGEGRLTVQSAIEEGLAKLLWKSGNRLQITTSKKWIDFLSFLMFDYH
jgi:hypothetical protein